MFGCKGPLFSIDAPCGEDAIENWVSKHRVRTTTPAGNDRNAETEISSSIRYEVSRDT